MSRPSSSDPDAVAVRPAERSDLFAVYDIERASFEQPWPFASFERFLDAPAFLVAVEGTASPEGAIVGYVVADTTPNHGRDIGHVKDLAVASGKRRRGIGRRLLRKALVELAMAGAAVVKLEVRQGNGAAKALYRAEGFEPLRRIPRYYDDGEAAIVMVLDLEEWQRAQLRESDEGSPDE